MISAFPERLRLVLDGLGGTQAYWAKRFKVHRRTLGNWLSGRDVPSFHTGCRIAAETHKSPFYYAGITNHPGVGVLTDDERDLLQFYRDLLPSERKLWRDSLRVAGNVGRISRKSKAF